MSEIQFNVWSTEKVDHPIYVLTTKKTPGEQSINWGITLNIWDNV